MKFRKKPVVIEAFQFGRDAHPDWFKSAIVPTSFEDIPPKAGDVDCYATFCFIGTLEGVMRGGEGDYIIQGVKGELYPCKADIFEATYEAV
jgi:hypothetical protein